MANSQALGRRMRMSGEKAFARVFAAKCSASDRNLVIYVVKNGADCLRIGLSVGRRAGGAVQRNRIKRLLREALRLEQDHLPAGFDIVCVPRYEAATLESFRMSIRAVTPRAVARWRAREAEGGDSGTSASPGNKAP